MAGTTTWTGWLRQRKTTLDADAGFEWRFACSVLRHVPDLSPSVAEIQVPFIDSNGGHRRMDFALREPGVKVAIEVDGYDKTGRGRGMTRDEFDDFLLRQTSLATQGWTVLRFSNRRFTSDPAACVREIELALKTARAAAAPTAPAPTTSELDELEQLRARSNDIDQLERLADEAEHRAAGAERVAGRERRRRQVIAAIAAAAVIGSGVYLQVRGDGQLGVPPDGNDCPTSAPIKGNRSMRTSEAIYHVPEGQFYAATTPVRCFETEDDAVAAGFRRSQR